VDHSTGAPLVPVGTFLGTQNSVFRTTIASLTGVLTLNRDTVTASLNSQDQKLISASNAAALVFGSNRGVYGSLNWAHLLRPNLQSTLYGQYGVTSGGGVSGSEQLVLLSATLSYALTSTLSGSLQYSYNRTFGGDLAPAGGIDGTVGTSSEQSLVLVSLIKSF